MKVNLAVVAASAAIMATSGALAQPQWKHVGTLGQRHMMVVEPAVATNVQLLKQAAATACVAAKPCVVAFWSDAAEVPSTMPMTMAQQQAMVAQYVRNPASGKEELMLKCTSADPAGTKCLR